MKRFHLFSCSLMNKFLIPTSLNKRLLLISLRLDQCFWLSLCYQAIFFRLTFSMFYKVDDLMGGSFFNKFHQLKLHKSEDHNNAFIGRRNQLDDRLVKWVDFVFALTSLYLKFKCQSLYFIPLCILNMWHISFVMILIVYTCLITLFYRCQVSNFHVESRWYNNQSHFCTTAII